MVHTYIQGNDRKEGTCLREEITTEAPSKPRRRAMAKPMPCVEAVTITTFPSNRFPVFSIFFQPKKHKLHTYIRTYTNSYTMAGCKTKNSSHGSRNF